MFPRGSVTDFYYFTGPGSHTVTTTPATLISYSFKQGNVSSDTDMMCGDTVLFKNTSTDIPFTLVNYYCPDGLHFEKTGNDNAQVTMTVYPGNYNETLDPLLAPGMVNSFLLLVLICLTIAGGIFGAIFGRRARLNYYNVR